MICPLIFVVSLSVRNNVFIGNTHKSENVTKEKLYARGSAKEIVYSC